MQRIEANEAAQDRHAILNQARADLADELDLAAALEARVGQPDGQTVKLRLVHVIDSSL